MQAPLKHMLALLALTVAVVVASPAVALEARDPAWPPTTPICIGPRAWPTVCGHKTTNRRAIQEATPTVVETVVGEPIPTVVETVVGEPTPTVVETVVGEPIPTVVEEATPTALEARDPAWPTVGSCTKYVANAWPPVCHDDGKTTRRAVQQAAPTTFVKVAME